MGDRPFALARKASGAAQKRLRAEYADEYDRILAEERQRLGLPLLDTRSVSEENRLLRKRIAELEAQL